MRALDTDTDTDQDAAESEADRGPAAAAAAAAAANSMSGSAQREGLELPPRPSEPSQGGPAAHENVLFVGDRARGEMRSCVKCEIWEESGISLVEIP